jgi:hypothetical protein
MCSHACVGSFDPLVFIHPVLPRPCSPHISPPCVCGDGLQVPRRFSSTQAGKMSYEDFVWFILSEEDKTTDTAIEYWFRWVEESKGGWVEM